MPAPSGAKFANSLRVVEGTAGPLHGWWRATTTARPSGPEGSGKIVNGSSGVLSRRRSMSPTHGSSNVSKVLGSEGRS